MKNEAKTKENTTKTTKTLVRVALMTVIITVCAWINVPYVVPFTLQTFAVFLALLLLGGRWGTVSICVYVLLAAIGVPVLAGFKGGVGALVGPTGGYVFGFVLSGLVYALLPFKKKNVAFSFLACVISLTVCYLCGTLWFWLRYTDNGTIEGFWYAFTLCVAPYIAFDIVKIFFAEALADKLKKIVFFDEN